jgi:hypothetical protein
MEKTLFERASHYVAQASLELTILLMLGLQRGVTMPN